MVATSGPSFAASRSQYAGATAAQSLDAAGRARTDEWAVEAPYNAYASGASQYQVPQYRSPVTQYPTQNLPYADRPYGAPDGW